MDPDKGLREIGSLPSLAPAVPRFALAAAHFSIWVYEKKYYYKNYSQFNDSNEHSVSRHDLQGI
jgi:hypothetical protein